jgi:hypothetical protein
MKISYKVKISIMTIIIVAIVPYVLIKLGIGISFPCACIDEDVAIRGELKYIRKILEDEKSKQGFYPTFKRLREILKNEEYTLKILTNNTSDIKSTAIYYKQIENGKKYKIKGYAKGNLIGISVVADVENNLSNLIDFDD